VPIVLDLFAREAVMDCVVCALVLIGVSAEMAIMGPGVT
jgi:hypothetical protein